MFGTIIMDSYVADEAKTIANNLDIICSPMNNMGWASVIRRLSQILQITCGFFWRVSASK